LFAWPGAKLAVMGAAQLAGVPRPWGSRLWRPVGRSDEEADQRRRAAIEAQIEAESRSFVTARLTTTAS
jgi:acetyl-CoA carboxylase carboxyltransferase component